MKKVCILFAIVWGVIFSAYSQTFYYKQESTVDEYGVKSQGSGKIICITFVNSKRVCYPSDKNGNKTGQDQYLFKQTTASGVHLYTSAIKEKVEKLHATRNQNFGNYFGLMGTYNSQNGYEEGVYIALSTTGFPIYKYSNDFSRLNISYINGSNQQTKPTEVWVKVASPVEQTDDFMY